VTDLGFVVDEEDYLKHYGILRKSGRYPWGSGGDEVTRSRDFFGTIAELRSQGMTDPEIMRGFGMNTSDWRAAKSVARNQIQAADIATAQRLSDKGMSNVAIGKQMGKNESQIRALLAPGRADRTDVLKATANMLKEQVAKKQFVDVGSGAEYHIPTGISSTKLRNAVSMLKQEGYEEIKVQVPQLGTNKKTIIKVLAPPGTTYRDVNSQQHLIQQIGDYTDDGGRSWNTTEYPISISSKRVGIRYADKGGADADGVVYVRPGVKDLSMGGSRYAQVRVAVDGTHFIKGMAMYKDDLPEGVDLLFNTNKKDTGNKLDALKPLKEDKDLPFGAMISRQIGDPQPGGRKKLTSVMNIVNDESDWERWSKNLSSQFLSKQSRVLAREQLTTAYKHRREELDRILKLNNPAVRRRLLEDFAEGADAAASHLKAAALPGQKTHVILPVNSMKETEVYAPNYNNGDHVALVRFPHGGVFEIPDLVVNNKNPEAKKLLGPAENAIGINSKVAQKLSGADFDGDTVLVIPNNRGQVKHSPSLEGLKGFDPQAQYPYYEGMKVMNAREKGTQMGLVSNLITDMTIKGANDEELARAVRHSMVVIDAEKHKLNWKLSAIKNNISQLMKTYQGRSEGGAATLVSRRKSRLDVPERREGFKIDPLSGKKIYSYTDNEYTDPRGRVIKKTTKSTKLAEADDAHSLSSGTAIEAVYADYSNSMKALANEARKESVHIKPTPKSSAARTVHAAEVASLEAKLHRALANAPLERQAQLIANAVYKAKRDANPDMEESEKKKIKGVALENARARMGARKQRVEITDAEWDAIQAGAISPTMLEKILNNADLDRVKQLATPKSTVSLSPTSKTKAQSLLNLGYTYAEIAGTLGVSTTAVRNSLSEED
jgi:hypothetical protein